MNPRTHSRGAPPDFKLPKPNPNPSRMTDALWWLVCMREQLEPSLSDNGGTFADKPGSHNAGENLRDYGRGDPRTDHSIRDARNRTGPWWRTKCSAHDWTFRDAQKGNYQTISKYTNRLLKAMRDPNDPRPDHAYFYTLGQADNDKVVEGYNERDNENESGDSSHLWHRHDSFWRDIIGDYWAMWMALTIDMGWTVAEWKQSLPKSPEVKMIKIEGEVPELKKGMEDPVDASGTYWIRRAQRQLQVPADGDYGAITAGAVKEMMKAAPTRSSNDGTVIGLPEWRRLYGIW